MKNVLYICFTVFVMVAYAFYGDQQRKSYQPPVVTLKIIAGRTNYVVLRGDNFSTISKRLNISRTQLHKANPNVDDTRLPIGQTIILP
jgi:LysM repeat protein